MKKVRIRNIPKGARYLVGFDNKSDSGVIQQRDIIETGVFDKRGEFNKEYNFDSNIIIRVRCMDWLPIEIKLREVEYDVVFQTSMVRDTYYSIRTIPTIVDSLRKMITNNL